MKKYCFVCCLLIFTLYLNAQEILIPKDKIASEGNFRIGDFLQGIYSGTYSSIDGYFTQFSINGLNDFQHQNCTILIDNHHLSFDYFGLKNINSLPINFSSIDSIVLINQPQFYEGHFENNGVVHIFTDKAKSEKFYFRNRINFGNESKDSGPYRYTKYESPNVDKTGTEFSSSFAYNFKNHSILSNFHYRQHTFTDWSTRHRIENIDYSNKFPMLIEYGGSLICNGNLQSHRYSILLSSVKTDDLFLYFAPLGHELPLNNLNNHIGLFLNTPINEDLNLITKVNYETDYTQNLLTKGVIENLSGIEKFQSDFQFTLNNNLNISSFGINIDHRKLITYQDNLNKIQTIPEVYLNLQFHSRIFGETLISESFKFTDGKTYDNFILSNSKILSSKSDIKLILSKAKEINQLNAYDLWLSENYFSHSINIRQLSQKTDNIKYTADIIFDYHIFKNFKVAINYYNRFFKDYNLREQNFQFNEEDYSFYSQTINYLAATGLVKGLNGSIHWTQSDFLNFDLNFYVQSYNSNDEIFLTEWNKIPKKSINYSFLFTPVNSFSVWLKIHHSSQTIWKDYKDVSGIEFFNTYRSSYTYNYILDPIHSVDIKIKKSFMDNKLSANFLIRNLTNNKIKYHPVGASFDMSMFLGLEYNF